MAQHPNGGGYDPRYNGQINNNSSINNNNNQYTTYYDPRYQRQPYAYPTPNAQVQIPMGGMPYNGMQPQSAVPHQSPTYGQQSPVILQRPPLAGQSNYTNHQYYPQPAYQHQHFPAPQYPSPQAHQAQLPPLQHHTPSPHLPPHSPPVRQSSQPTVNRQHVEPHSAGRVVKEHPKTVTTNGSRPVKAPAVAPAPVTAPVPVPVPAPAPPAPPPLDINYTDLFIDLADRFLSEAYSSNSSRSGRHSDPDIFAKLISNGLACFDLVLGKYKANLQPSLEASIRLKYASILCAETQNYMDAEEILSKGVSLCDRYRFASQKYNMQHLLARVTYSKNPKAAVRYVDGLIRDIEAVQKTPWIYAMRFLRVTLALQISTSQEILTASNQLRQIASIATSKKDKSVAAIAYAVEALLHLTHSSGSDGIEHIQRALASSRSLQLDPQTQEFHHLTIMNHFVDLGSSILQSSFHDSGSKMVDMNKFLDAHSHDQTLTPDGEFLVPLQGSVSPNSDAAALSGGIINIDEKGQVALRMKWLPRDEIYVLGYLLSAAATTHKNAHDGQKAEAFLKEAQAVLTGSRKKAAPSITSSWRENLACHVQVQIVLALSARSSWSSARTELESLKAAIKTLQPSRQGIFPVFAAFLEAMILQGTGKTTEALDVYYKPPLSLYTTDLSHAPPAHHDLALLAGLNTLMIVCIPSHPQHSRTNTLLSTLEPLASEHPSRDIQAAYHLIRAVSLNVSSSASEMEAESATMLKTKQYLQTALQLAKHTANNQLCCITLNFMSFKYFRGVVGAQAQKSASSAQALAKKGQDPLWTSVAHGLLAETLETQGKSQEAEKVRVEGLEEARHLPEPMWRRADEPAL